MSVHADSKCCLGRRVRSFLARTNHERRVTTRAEWNVNDPGEVLGNSILLLLGWWCFLLLFSVEVGEVGNGRGY